MPDSGFSSNPALQEKHSQFSSYYSLQAVGPTFAFLALFVLWNIYRRIRPLPLSKSLPGPKSYPFVGILPHLIKAWEYLPDELGRLSKKYGRTFGGGMPNLPGFGGAFFFVFDESSVKHILSENFQNYEKGEAFRSLYGDLLGHGIFVSDGHMWKVHRKIMSHMFSRNLLQQTARVTLSKLEKINSLFRDKIKADAEPNISASIDLQDIFFKLTFDTTSYVALGCEIDSLQSKGEQHPFAIAFDELQLLITKRFLDPLYGLKRFFQIGSRERRISFLKKIIANESSTFIHSRRRSVEEGGSLGPDLLSRLLDHAKKEGNAINDDELHSAVVNILLAGRDTTACALSWAFYELTKNPKVIQKIVKEVGQICGGLKKDDVPDYSYDKICELRYTHAVAMEVLRLHPSVPVDTKHAINDDVLPDGTLIPAGAGVTYLIFAMGRSESIWGEDALHFRPERFLDAKEPSQFKYTVFNAGPRSCLGKPLALMTMKMALAYLLPRFDFKDSNGHSGAYQWSFVSSMKGGFPVDVSWKDH